MSKRYWPNQIEQWIFEEQMRRFDAAWDAGEEWDCEPAELWPSDPELALKLHKQGYNRPGVYPGEACPVCGAMVQQIRRAARQRVYCSDACKMRAYRWRKEQRGQRSTYGVDPNLVAWLRWRREHPDQLERFRAWLGLGPTTTRRRELWELLRLEARLRGEGHRGRWHSYNLLRKDI